MNNDPSKKDGRYLYCLIKGEATDLNLSGINNETVNTLTFRGLTVVSHPCKTEPYFSADNDVVARWVTEHHNIVDKYWLRYGNVLPFTFNTIIKSNGLCIQNDLLLKWLADNYEYIQSKLSAIEGRKEYGVQVIMDSKKTAELLIDSEEQLVRLKEDLCKSTKGKAFLIKEKINAKLKLSIESEADKIFRYCYSTIEKNVNRINLQKIKKLDGNKIMLLNLNCLADDEHCRELGQFLDQVNEISYLEVIFSGPWPPYSFM